MTEIRELLWASKTGFAARSSSSSIVAPFCGHGHAGFLQMPPQRPTTTRFSTACCSRLTRLPLSSSPSSSRHIATAASAITPTSVLDASGHVIPGKMRMKKRLERETKVDPAVKAYLAAQRVGLAKTRAQRRSQWFEMTHGSYAPRFLDQLRPSLQMVTSAIDVKQLPSPQLPEVAFAGRSNSGKSTLLNALTGWGRALTKRTPGSTTELVFWNVGKPATLRFVDLPGYGFACASEEKRVQWTEFTLWYLKHRGPLRLVLVLCDSRVGLVESDREFLSFLDRHSVKWQLVFTKCDKVDRRELARRVSMVNQHELGGYDLGTASWQSAGGGVVGHNSGSRSMDGKRYRHMHSAPIPISALRRQNLESVRAVLNPLAMSQEVVVNGTKQRVYDLVELQRIRRTQKAERRRLRLREREREQSLQVQQADVTSTLKRWGLDEEEEETAVVHDAEHSCSMDNMGTRTLQHGVDKRGALNEVEQYEDVCGGAGSAGTTSIGEDDTLEVLREPQVLREEEFPEKTTLSNEDSTPAASLATLNLADGEDDVKIEKSVDWERTEVAPAAEDDTQFLSGILPGGEAVEAAEDIFSKVEASATSCSSSVEDLLKEVDESGSTRASTEASASEDEDCDIILEACRLDSGDNHDVDVLKAETSSNSTKIASCFYDHQDLLRETSNRKKERTSSYYTFTRGQAPDPLADLEADGVLTSFDLTCGSSLSSDPTKESSSGTTGRWTAKSDEDAPGIFSPTAGSAASSETAGSLLPDLSPVADRVVVPPPDSPRGKSTRRERGEQRKAEQRAAQVKAREAVAAKIVASNVALNKDPGLLKKAIRPWEPVVSEQELAKIANKVEYDHVKEHEEGQAAYDPNRGLSEDEQRIAFRNFDKTKQLSSSQSGSLEMNQDMQEEIKRRHRTEWRSSLDNTDHVAHKKNIAASVEGKHQSAITGASRGPASTGAARGGTREAQLLPPSAAATSPHHAMAPSVPFKQGSRIGLFTDGISDILPRGIRKWKVVGKPKPHTPATMNRSRDVAAILRCRLNRNGDEIIPKKSGNAMTFQEAKKKMQGWAARHRRRKSLVAESGNWRNEAEAREEWEQKRGVRLADLPTVDPTGRRDPCATRELKQGLKMMQKQNRAKRKGRDQ
ncbi:unnamed protein product [Amoebophrya sp. A25]|nr:unnamed protein product [Amoebophrya sp. A25]|eukprot:GSA25T00025015001.1